MHSWNRTLTLKTTQDCRCNLGDIHIEMKCGSLELIIVSIGSYRSNSERNAMNGVNLNFRVTEIDMDLCNA